VKGAGDVFTLTLTLSRCDAIIAIEYNATGEGTAVA